MANKYDILIIEISILILEFVEKTINQHGLSQHKYKYHRKVIN